MEYLVSRCRSPGRYCYVSSWLQRLHRSFTEIPPSTTTTGLQPSLAIRYLHWPYLYITHHLSYAAIILGLLNPESKGNTILQNNEEHLHNNPVSHPRILEFSANFNLTFTIIILAIFNHLVVCLTTGPKPLPNWALHTVRSIVSSFNCEYPLLSLRSTSSFLRFLPRFPVTSIPPFIFPSI